MVSMQIILFGFLAILIIASALGMLLSKNSIYSAVFLVMNFILVAIIYLYVGGSFYCPDTDHCLCRGDHGALSILNHARGW